MQAHAPSVDPTKAAGFLNLLLMGGQSEPDRSEQRGRPGARGAVLWVHAGAVWNDESVESQALAFVDGLWAILDSALQSQTAMYGVPISSSDRS